MSRISDIYQDIRIRYRALFGQPPQPRADSGADALRTLFIGNSFTYVNDLPWQIEQLATSANAQPLATAMIASGGATLHWHGRSRQVRRTLRQPWHYVVLQEQSTRPIEQPALMLRSAQQIARQIAATGATTVLYLTWPRQDRPELQAALTAAYQRCAADLQARIAPVGPAWQAAREACPQLQLYDQDQIHPSPIGSYLAACVLYATLYRQSPVGVSRRIFSSQFNTAAEGKRIELAGLADADALTLQQIAWDTAERYR